MANIYYVKKGNLITIYNVSWDFIMELQNALGNIEDYDKLLNDKFKVAVRVPIFSNQKEMSVIKELIEKYEKENQ